MKYSNKQLQEMTLEELNGISIQDMSEDPPRRSAGMPYIVRYECRFCGQKVEGSERCVKNLDTAKPVKCPYCKAILWSPEEKNHLRKTAFAIGHFDTERKKAYLKYLKQFAKMKERFNY